jgi:hypothetical protein
MPDLPVQYGVAVVFVWAFAVESMVDDLRLESTAVPSISRTVDCPSLRAVGEARVSPAAAVNLNDPHAALHD